MHTLKLEACYTHIGTGRMRRRREKCIE
uniref:Uncharacterized protein n=1 Tax=Rhizophora mucronata TaxID=61149 RepID=A0A2P2IVG2_RHIMU